ncbi:hypothetical protein XENTR_v10020351 [Xenopus tropicalis]|nr:hypothetical protein XENTR_v10020351 [Xenopus tropicalis]
MRSINRNGNSNGFMKQKNKKDSYTGFGPSSKSQCSPKTPTKNIIRQAKGQDKGIRHKTRHPQFNKIKTNLQHNKTGGREVQDQKS